jgi:hypothetical protein
MVGVGGQCGHAKKGQDAKCRDNCGEEQHSTFALPREPAREEAQPANNAYDTFLEYPSKGPVHERALTQLCGAAHACQQNQSYAWL